MSPAAQQVQVGDLRWTVARSGRGPLLLLVHGMGASHESWRSLAARLAERFTVVAVDLPGHGGTPPLSRPPTLERTAECLAGFVRRLDAPIEAAIGHSAGAAILARMAIDDAIDPRLLVAFNGAFYPFRGGANSVFAAAARLMTSSRMVARVFARRAHDRSRVERLIRSMGSSIDDDGIAHYQRLASSPEHVANVLAMMANWRLEPLLEDLPRLQPPLLLVVGREDHAIPPIQSLRIAGRVPRGRFVTMSGGHLSHEEAPDEAAKIVFEAVATS